MYVSCVMYGDLEPWRKERPSVCWVPHQLFKVLTQFFFQICILFNLGKMTSQVVWYSFSFLFSCEVYGLARQKPTERDISRQDIC